MNAIAIIGSDPVGAELAAACTQAGFEVTYAPVGGGRELQLPAPPPGVGVARSAGEAVKGAEMILEATADRETRQRVLAEAGRAAPPSAVILTYLPDGLATEAGRFAERPTLTGGFAYPPPLAAARLVEVAPALGADPVVEEIALAFWKRLGKEAALVRDGAGMVLFRILCMIINEAAFALAEGLASARDIDMAMKLGVNYPYGPLEWGDKVGLDRVLGVLCALQAELGEDRYRPAPLLRRMVLAGQTGERAGRGFYTYR